MREQLEALEQEIERTWKILSKDQEQLSRVIEFGETNILGDDYLRYNSLKMSVNYYNGKLEGLKTALEIMMLVGRD